MSSFDYFIWYFKCQAGLIEYGEKLKPEKGFQNLGTGPGTFGPGTHSGPLTQLGLAPIWTHWPIWVWNLFGSILGQKRAGRQAGKRPDGRAVARTYVRVFACL